MGRWIDSTAVCSLRRCRARPRMKRGGQSPRERIAGVRRKIRSENSRPPVACRAPASRARHRESRPVGSLHPPDPRRAIWRRRRQSRRANRFQLDGVRWARQVEALADCGGCGDEGRPPDPGLSDTSPDGLLCGQAGAAFGGAPSVANASRIPPFGRLGVEADWFPRLRSPPSRPPSPAGQPVPSVASASSIPPLGIVGLGWRLSWWPDGLFEAQSRRPR